MREVCVVFPWGKQAFYLTAGILVGFLLFSCAVGPDSTRFPRALQPSEVRPLSPPPSQYPSAAQGDYINYPAMRDFIGMMNRQHGFDKTFLEQVFSAVKRDQAVLAKVASPAEAKGWEAYRAIFMTEDRVNGGVAFWNRYTPVLDSVSRQYGVDPEYIVAVMGVETQYGKNTGKHNVLSALTTLGFDYPPRGDFYRKELEQYMLLVREERLYPTVLSGSYAGAMGLGQFISSSYRHYAVDGNRDGKRDLWNPQDAIPSVANYLSRHGWQRGGGVAVPAAVNGNGRGIADTTPKKPSHSLAELGRTGVYPRGAIHSAQLGLIRLEGVSDEYWIIGNNFHTITRYNINIKYAMVVHQLAQAIRQRKFGF